MNNKIAIILVALALLAVGYFWYKRYKAAKESVPPPPPPLGDDIGIVPDAPGGIYYRGNLS